MLRDGGDGLLAGLRGSSGGSRGRPRLLPGQRRGGRRSDRAAVRGHLGSWRATGPGEAAAQSYRVRASAALSAFTNALAVSLFALIPGHKIGPTALAVGLGGLVFVATALLSLIRRRQRGRPMLQDAVFLIGLVVLFTVQMVQGIVVIAKPDNASAVNTIAVLVVVCFLIGIARAWELIGGPSFSFTHELRSLVRDHQNGSDDPEGGKP
jgi:hypothetical protein